MACAEWLAACLRLGWDRSALDALEELWWKYHDKNGALLMGPTYAGNRLKRAADAAEVDVSKTDEEIIASLGFATDGPYSEAEVREAIRLAREDSAAYHDENAARLEREAAQATTAGELVRLGNKAAAERKHAAAIRERGKP